jgi:hypothetical protein
MIIAPPEYVASDGSRPKSSQSATATKKTLNLLIVSERLRLEYRQWHSHRSDGGEDRARPSDKCEK